MSTYKIQLVNMTDGTVAGHKAGCRDLAKLALRHDVLDVEETTSKRAAWLEYNVDFIAEGGEENAWPIDWKACTKHVPAGEEATEAPEEAVKDWPGNYNTVFAPAAELFASADAAVATVAVRTMLKQSHVTGAGAASLVAELATLETEALAALQNWQRTLDRKGQTEMEKYNQNRSFLAGYLATAAQQATGAKKRPSVAFAKDMERAIRTDALAAGTAARKEATK